MKIRFPKFWNRKPKTGNRPPVGDGNEPGAANEITATDPTTATDPITQEEPPTMAAAIVPIVMAGLQVAPTVVEFISGLIKRAEVNKPQPGQGQSRKAEVAAAAQRWAVPGELPAGATPQQIASLVQAVFDRVNQAGEVNRPPAQVVQGAVPGSAPNGHDMAAVAADVASVPVPAPVQGPNFYMPTDQDPALSPAGQLIELAIDRYIREAGPGDLAGMLLSWCRLRITDHRNRLAVTETRLAEALSSPQSR